MILFFRSLWHIVLRSLHKLNWVCIYCYNPDSGNEGRVIYWSSGLILLKKKDGTTDTFTTKGFSDEKIKLFCKIC